MENAVKINNQTQKNLKDDITSAMTEYLWTCEMFYKESQHEMGQLCFMYQAMASKRPKRFGETENTYSATYIITIADKQGNMLNGNWSIRGHVKDDMFYFDEEEFTGIVNEVRSFMNGYKAALSILALNMG